MYIFERRYINLGVQRGREALGGVWGGEVMTKIHSTNMVFNNIKKKILKLNKNEMIHYFDKSDDQRHQENIKLL